MDKLEKLKELVKLLQNNSITPKEIEGFLNTVLKVIRDAKTNFETVSAENISVIKDAVKQLESKKNILVEELDKIAQTKKDEVSSEIIDTKKEFIGSLKEIKDFLKEVKKIKSIPGKDAYTPIKGVDYFDGKDGFGIDGTNGKDGKDGGPDSRLQIVEKINTGSKDDLKIQTVQVEGLEKKTKDLDFALGVLDQRTQFLINKQGGSVKTIVAGTNITVDSADPANPIISSTGGGGTPGGSNTQVQFNDGGVFGGDSAFVYDKTNNIVTVDEVDVSYLISKVNSTLTVANTNDGYDLNISTNNVTGVGNAGIVSISAGKGGTTSGSGGDLLLSSGGGYFLGSGKGGSVQIFCGNGFGNSDGGLFYAAAGNGGGSGVGGDVQFVAGSGGGSNGGDAGNILFTAGNALGGNSNGGSVTLEAGVKTGSGITGQIKMRLGGGFYAILDTASIATSDKIFTFPNISGTFALMGGSDTQVLYNDSGVIAGDVNFIWDKNNKFLILGGTNASLEFNDNGSSTTFYIKALTQTNINTPGSTIQISAGNGESSTGGNGGLLALYGGDAGPTGNGGQVTINAGTGSPTGVGGDIRFRAGGGGGGGNPGSTVVVDAASGIAAILDLTILATSDKTFTFPNVSGTLVNRIATINTTGLTANVGASTLYSVPADGERMYRVSAYVVETTAGSISSTLPNVQIVYTDKDSNTSVTIDATPILGVAGIGQTGALTANTVGTASSGVIVIYVKASTTIQYQTVNYASNLAGMTYALRIRLETV